MKKKIMTMAMMALAFTACTEEDLMQPTQGDAGTLHIASVTIDGQEVARSRVVTDDDTYDYSMSNQPYNQSFRMFTASDRLTLVTNGLSAGEADTQKFYATYNGTTWTISDPQDGTTPVSLQPTDTWANASIEAAFGGGELSGISDDYPSTSQRMDVVQGDIPRNSSIIYRDWLVASTGNGVIIDTDLKSPTLGAVTIKLKHAHALLRLPMTAANVTPGTYIVNGTAHNVTGLGTLWAVLNMSSTSTTIYSPLTKVTIKGTDYLQAIVPSTTANGSYTLTGFKAVMLTEESGASGEETTQNSQLTTQNFLTLDLPFKVGEATTASTGIALEPNHQYPLTLNIAPHTASISLFGGLGKPGWGTENELSNEQNEIALREVTYDAGTSTFSVSGATGLRLVALYMNGEVTIDGWPTDDRLKQNITLTADINFPEVEDGESNWTPIAMSTIENGDQSDYYYGTIDGGGHKITGMRVNSSEQDMSKRFGLVGHLYNTGVVKNLTFEDCTINGYYGAGLAVGYNYYGTIINCHALANCTVTAAFYYAGGIVGTSDGRIVSCTSAATVTANTGCAGGITGGINSHGFIAACSATGHVSVTETGDTPGGLVGEHYGKMYGCWSTAITGTGDAVTTLDVVGTVGSLKVIGSSYTTATTATYGTPVTEEALNAITDNEDPIELMNTAIATYNNDCTDLNKKSPKHWAADTSLPVLVNISSTSGE